MRREGHYWAQQAGSGALVVTYFDGRLFQLIGREERMEEDELFAEGYLVIARVEEPKL